MSTIQYVTAIYTEYKVHSRDKQQVTQILA